MAKYGAQDFDSSILKVTKRNNYFMPTHFWVPFVPKIMYMSPKTCLYIYTAYVKLIQLTYTFAC